ncbi:hypothetical protein IF188_09700 [Microbacterium sp. NEAU-LLC]|uniref:DNA-binding protein n=1 Tax=Microbacterium helvum TaxID=2773713 RepID=A0ABR8NPQ0_9MICO|nr:hypothetical protein [Microbacterium helvum]MBD3941968.1 hypothetical protein [Microbacterium helvum]
MTLTYDTTPALPAAKYAELVGKTERTVKRWLEDDELPGAYKDDRGRWMIPVGAERTPRPAGDVVQLQPQQSIEHLVDTGVRRAIDAAAALPSFLTLDQAAEILGISRHAIATHRDYFGVVPFGANGSLVVPLATIKRIRG